MGYKFEKDKYYRIDGRNQCRIMTEKGGKTQEE